jgi:biotin operon repressor
MSSAAVVVPRVAWGWETERELIEAYDDGDGLNLTELADQLGRTRNAIEQKLSELRKRGEVEAFDPAGRVARRPNQDALHVIAALAQGGFAGIVEQVLPRGVRCLVRGAPLIYPASL